MEKVILTALSSFATRFRLSLVFGLRGIKAAVGSLNYWLFLDLSDDTDNFVVYSHKG